MHDNVAQYSYWRSELSKPGLLSRDTSDPVAGFWRLTGAKTKPDYPCAIWYSPEGDPIWSVGRQRPEAGETDAWHEFMGMTFPKAVAVTDEEYERAMETGFWGDGKNSRKMTEEERLGIDTGAGDNAAPVEETLADQIEALAEKINDTPEPKTQGEADRLAGLLDKMRALLKLLETERVAAKEPHLQASREVDAKYKAIGEPGGNAYRDGTARQKAYLKRLQEELDRKAAEEQRQREAEAREERDRLAEEARKAAKEAGENPEEIEIPEVEVTPVEAQRATAGSSFGRSSGLRKVRKAVIEDAKALVLHFIEVGDADLLEYLQKRADRAVKAKVSLVGVNVKEVLE